MPLSISMLLQAELLCVVLSFHFFFHKVLEVLC